MLRIGVILSGLSIRFYLPMHVEASAAFHHAGVSITASVLAIPPATMMRQPYCRIRITSRMQQSPVSRAVAVTNIEPGFSGKRSRCDEPGHEMLTRWVISGPRDSRRYCRSKMPKALR